MKNILKSTAFKFRLESVPHWLLRSAERYFDVLGLRMAKSASENPYLHGPLASEYESACPYRMGIFKDVWNLHWPYIQACREMKVRYQVLDLTKADWMAKVESSRCHAFLVWPTVQSSHWKELFDERLRVLSQDLGKVLCQSVNEIWPYESKRRISYWLEANDIPHPRTWIFYHLDEAIEFLQNAYLPLIFKPNRGSGASGMKVFRNRLELICFVKRYFRKGLLRPRDDWRDRQWGSVCLQQYLDDVDEWRMIRIGKSYFGYKKGKQGDFHSGSHVVIFDDPPKKLLDFTEWLTECGGFRSMSFDILETNDGSYLVNELHPVFGRDPWDHSMEVDGRPGRYVRNQENREWEFEEGVFTENSCCNLRMQMVIEDLLSRDSVNLRAHSSEICKGQPGAPVPEST